MPDRFALSASPGHVHYFRSPIVDNAPPETFEGLSWFVVTCNVKCEKRAQLGLRRKGYATYLPTTKRWRVHARKKEVSESALFPRYLFIGLKPGQDLYAMRSVDGVEGVVRNDTIPVRIPPESLSRLLEREQADEFDYTKLPELGPQYMPGDQVRLTAGAFTDVQGQVVSMLSKGRVEVLVSFMNQATRMKLSAKELHRLEAAE